MQHRIPHATNPMRIVRTVQRKGEPLKFTDNTLVPGDAPEFYDTKKPRNPEIWQPTQDCEPEQRGDPGLTKHMCGWNSGARRKSDYQPCHGHAMPNRRCRMHGGKSLTPGLTHPRTKHGRHGKYAMPNYIQEEFARHIADPDLVGLRYNLAAVDAFIDELGGRLDVGGSNAMWKRLNQLADDLRVASKNDDQKASQDIVNEQQQ